MPVSSRACLLCYRYNKVKERSESMTAEEVEEIMRKKIVESFQVSIRMFICQNFLVI